MPVVFDECVTPARFGIRLRELRMKAGVSQLELSRRTGFSQASISEWEAGISEPRVSAVPTLAAALGVKGSAFLADPSPDVPKSPRGRPKKIDPDD